MPMSDGWILSGRWRPVRRCRRWRSPARRRSGARGASAEPAKAPTGADRFVANLLRLGPEATRRGARRGGCCSRAGRRRWRRETTYRVGMALAVDGKPEQAVPFLERRGGRRRDPAPRDEWSWPPGVVLLRARVVPARGARVRARRGVRRRREDARRSPPGCAAWPRCWPRTRAAARACIAALPGGLGPAGGELDELIGHIEIDVHATRAIWGGVLSAVVPGLGQADRRRPGDAAPGAAGERRVRRGGLLPAGRRGGRGRRAGRGWGSGCATTWATSSNGAEAWRAAAERKRDRASARLIRILGPAP